VSATLRAIDIYKAQFAHPQPEGKLYFVAKKFPSLHGQKSALKKRGWLKHREHHKIFSFDAKCQAVLTWPRTEIFCTQAKRTF
jgi:hypothetical protein